MSTVGAEWLKMRTTRTSAGVATALAGVVTLAALVHDVGFKADMVDTADEQRRILLDIGVNLGLVFAAVAGALSITTEFRHGTIRAALLKQPDRSRLLVAKGLTQSATGVLGALGAGYATVLTVLFLSARGISFEVDAGDVAQLVVGGALAAVQFGAIGLGVGALVRNQVTAVVGLLMWLLFIENLLRAGSPAMGKFAPGSLGRAMAGQTDAALGSPILAGALLLTIAAASLTAGGIALVRGDVA